MSDLPSDRRRPEHPEHRVGAVGGADGALERIWMRIRRPVDPQLAIEALAGVPLRTARQVVGAAVAGSDEASALLSVMPQLIRNLSISTVAVPERCVGAVRGPVLWSETMSARAGSAGDDGIFVCSTVSRAYDTAENRLLVKALSEIVRGGRAVERLHDSERGEEPSLLADARHHADLAERFLDHRTLIGVRQSQRRRRAAGRVRRDPRRRGYQPVHDMLRRASEPLDVSTIRLFCDEQTTARHDLLVAAADHLESRGIRIPAFFVVEHEVRAGPLTFHHPAHAARHPYPDRPAGLVVGETRLDVPDGIDHDDVVVIHNRSELAQTIDGAITRGEV